MRNKGWPSLLRRCAEEIDLKNLVVRCAEYVKQPECAWLLCCDLADSAHG